MSINLEGIDGNLVEKLKRAFPQSWSEFTGEQISFLEAALGVTGGKPLYSIDGLTVKIGSSFYLGPFVSPFNEIYEDHIKPTVIALGLTVARADEIFGTRPIMQDIWESIFQSGLIIADVTGKNPNVLYEIGMAHTLGKPTIMITQDIDDVPFDLRHYRCLVYTHTPRGCADLSSKLSGTIESLSKVDYSLAARAGPTI